MNTSRIKRLLTSLVVLGITASVVANDRWWTTGSCAVGGAGTWSGGTAAQWSPSSTGGGCVSWVNGDSMFFGGGTAGATYAVQMGTAATTFTVNKIGLVSGGATRVDIVSSVTFPNIVFSGTDAGIDVPTGEYFTLHSKYSGTVLKTGAGRVDSPNTTTTSKWIVNGGFVSMPGANRLGATGSDAITFDGGGFGIGWASTFSAATFASNKGITVKAGGVFFGSPNTANTIFIQSPIIDGSGGAGNGGLNVTTASPMASPYAGGGVVNLQNTTSTANSYKGPTTVASNCKIVLGANNQIPNDSTVLLDTGSTVDLAGFSDTVKSVGNRTGTGGVLALGSGTITLDDPAGESYAGTISGTEATIIKKGSGLWTCTGSAGWGNSQIEAGTWAIGGVNGLGTKTLTVKGGRISSNGSNSRAIRLTAIELDGDLTIGDSVKTGTISCTNVWTITTSSRQITVDTINCIVAGPIGQDATGRGLTKAGSGTLVVSNGVNTYTGDTIVSDGTLKLNRDVTLASATLSVSGTASLAHNSAAGSAAVNALSLASGAQIAFAANGTAATVGKFTATDLTLNGNTVTVNVTGAALGAGTYRLIDYSGSKSGSLSSTPTITGLGLASGLVAEIAESAGGIDLFVYNPCTPPAAPNGTYTRAPGASLKIDLAALGVGAPIDHVSAGTQSATITFDSNYIYYLPQAGNDQGDSFTYTPVSPCAVSGTITVNVNQGTSEAKHISYSAGELSIIFAGIPGIDYDVQKSADSGFASPETKLTTNAPSAGLFEYKETMGEAGSAYYRLKQH